jgi:BirA family biotin operon repressor/biotin-[acetyl-CoA-carboxylase] ligase
MKVFRFKIVSSTQDAAKKLVEKGVEEGVVVADIQTSGRGRISRIWHSPRGGLWLSIILRPKVAPIYCLRLVLISGLAVVKAIHKVTGLNALIKWPNDVLIDGRKICGILIESETVDDLVKYVIVGIGINVNIKLEDLPPEVRAETTSLSEKLGKEVSVEEILKHLLKEFKTFHKRFLKEETEWIDEYRKVSCILGTNVCVSSEDGSTVCGRAVTIDEYGRLMLKLNNGTIKKFDYGEVTKVRT